MGMANGLSISRTGHGTFASARGHQLDNFLLPLFVAVQRQQRRPTDYRYAVAGKLVALEQVAHFEFDEFEKFGILGALTQRGFVRG